MVCVVTCLGDRHKDAVTVIDNVSDDGVDPGSMFDTLGICWLPLALMALVSIRFLIQILYLILILPGVVNPEWRSQCTNAIAKSNASHYHHPFSLSIGCWPAPHFHFFTLFNPHSFFQVNTHFLPSFLSSFLPHTSIPPPSLRHLPLSPPWRSLSLPPSGPMSSLPFSSQFS